MFDRTILIGHYKDYFMAHAAENIVLIKQLTLLVYNGRRLLPKKRAMASDFDAKIERRFYVNEIAEKIKIDGN